MFRRLLYILLLVVLTTTSCYKNDKSEGSDALTDPEASLNVVVDSVAWKHRQDSLSFYSNHHYTNNYNFIVNRDSIVLYTQQPEEIISRYELKDAMGTDDASDVVEYSGVSLAETTAPDTVVVRYNEQLVVAEIRIVPQDSIDSVWVQVARDQMTFGWQRESELLPNVVPDDPISQFIDTFSNTHLIWMFIVFGLFAIAYAIRLKKRKNAKIVHFNDISSFYPTLLVLTVSFASVIYATIQVFYPEMWRHFYYHPTLNPFSVPFILCAFLLMVWLLPILAVATVDDVRKHLTFEETLMYLFGLGTVCMVDYLVFTLTTLYYIGYVLFVAYVWFAVVTFNRHRRLVYFCGRCGKAIQQKGRCPHCGAVNV